MKFELPGDPPRSHSHFWSLRNRRNLRGQVERLGCSLSLTPASILFQTDLFSCWEAAPLHPPGASLNFLTALGLFFNLQFLEKHHPTDPECGLLPSGR